MRPLLLTLVLALAVVLLPPVVPPAAAASCLPAGGASIAAAQEQPGDFRFTGRGWGHGAGMSQYGARGAAALGCTVGQILSTYYPGTTIANRSLSSAIRINVGTQRPYEAVVVDPSSAPIPWELCDSAGTSCQEVARQDPGAIWFADVEPDGSFRIREGVRLADGSYRFKPDVPDVWAGGTNTDLLRARLARDDENRLVSLPRKDNRYKWGIIEFDSVARVGDTDPYLFVNVEIADLDQYLYGLAEMPSSWPSAALQAQAIAGRSYAHRRHAGGIRADCRCHLYDSTRDQAYTGYDKESEPTYGSRWVAAVDATSGKVLTYDGQVAQTLYSSSHGGQSESSAFVFGGVVPYLVPVDDSRWDLESGNPYRTWAVSLSAGQVRQRLDAAGLGVGDVLSIALPDPKGAGGRVGDPARGAGGVVIRGTLGDRTISGNAFRSAIGTSTLRSTLFTVRADLSCAAPADAQLSGRITRVAGLDRVGTAVAVSGQFASAASVLVASSTQFPDALAGGALAAELGAPILLTPPDRLPAAVADEIRRLGADEAVILGGEAAVSAQVASDLAAIEGLFVSRVAGLNRFETAAEIAGRAAPGGASEVLLALGSHPNPSQAWPDAVAAGALLAAPGSGPLLLTAPDALPPATGQALAVLSPTTVTIVGGTAAVSTAVEDDLRARGYEVERIAGPDRYQTSVAVAQEALERAGGADGVLFATGTAFPDALAAGPLAALRADPIVLVPQCDLAATPAVRDFVTQQGFGQGIVIGGVGAVSSRVIWQLDQAL